MLVVEAGGQPQDKTKPVHPLLSILLKLSLRPFEAESLSRSRHDCECMWQSLCSDVKAMQTQHKEPREHKHVFYLCIWSLEIQSEMFRTIMQTREQENSHELSESDRQIDRVTHSHEKTNDKNDVFSWTNKTQTHIHKPQAGTSICRVIPALTSIGTRVTDVFESVRPHMDLTFNNIVAHINTVFVLRTRVDKYSVSGFVGQHSSRSEGSEHFADSNDQLTPHNRRPAEVKRPASPTSEHSKYVTTVHLFLFFLPFLPFPSLTERRSIERKFGEGEKK